ncbi:acetoacetate decarboxylase family protein [Actinocorallia populi]|uniref:acetoacetate decarboxylase family protein n=1 Tax=Actinocorallia populi TaxID=2079200 RepID=UPI0013008B8D|nr:acetoacetate decarboxylase family protein [Actinocorallia populi]
MTAHRVLDQTITMPVAVRDASAATVIYDVDLAAARRLAPEGFEVVESQPGRAQFVLALIDYRDNDLGSYLEIGTILFVRPDGSGPEGTFITRLPVDQEFTCVAGNQIWGYPKTVEHIELTQTPTTSRWTLTMDGALVLDITVPRGGTDEIPVMEMTSYTMLRGRPHATVFTQGGTGARLQVGGEGVSLLLGDHPVAAELAGLGLPSEPVSAVWIEKMQGSFEEPRPVAGERVASSGTESGR